MAEENKNIRIDQYLVKKFPQYSRAFLKSQILAGNVLVNGKITKPSYILKAGDKVETKITAPETAALQPNPDIKLKIIHEDENIIAIDKPPGISVHPSKSGQTDTITNALLAYYPPIKNIGDEPGLRPGIVHRLDKDTSGIMIIAKNNQAFDRLKKQFAGRKTVKKYITLVYGNLKEEKGIITKPIGKTKDFRRRTTAPLKEQKEAVTYYKVTEKYGHYTLLEAEPKTGRTHQIRVHLASIGHPVAGDSLYAFKNQTPPPGLKRQFLHASYLKFSALDGKMVELKSELPDDLREVLKNLKTSNNS